MAGMRLALLFAPLFVIPFSLDEVSGAKNQERNTGGPLSYANFVRDPFHYLNATKVGSSLVTKASACNLQLVLTKLRISLLQPPRKFLGSLWVALAACAAAREMSGYANTWCSSTEVSPTPQVKSAACNDSAHSCLICDIQLKTRPLLGCQRVASRRKNHSMDFRNSRQWPISLIGPHVSQRPWNS